MKFPEFINTASFANDRAVNSKTLGFERVTVDRTEDGLKMVPTEHIKVSIHSEEAYNFVLLPMNVARQLFKIEED